MSWNSYGYKPYVPVASRRRQAEAEAKRLGKQGKTLSPVRVEGRNIAHTFWGKSWCTNLEGYSDYSNRLPRGRTYVRNGSVIDLQIQAGTVKALVQGSDLYEVTIAVKQVPEATWAALRKDCAGSINSLVELLQGKLSAGVMERICRRKTGLFPAPAEINLKCSCPDWASMCKHVAAVLYGVGARLDHQPELLFTLRQVNHLELVAEAGRGLSAALTSDRVLEGDDLGDLFGLEMGEVAVEARPAVATAPSAPKPRPKPKPKPRPALKPAPKPRSDEPDEGLAARIVSTRAWVARLESKLLAGEATSDDKATHSSLKRWLEMYPG